MSVTLQEIVETLDMIHSQTLDIRTVTLGIDLRDCANENIERVASNAYDKIMRIAKDHVKIANDVSAEYAIPIVNKRISVTPVSWFAAACKCEDYTPIAISLDKAAHELGVDFIGGFSALVEKDMSISARRLINSLPDALCATERLCSSVNIGSTHAGINMDAVGLIGRTIKTMAEATAENDAVACAKFVAFCNAVHDNPFMAGAFYGAGEGESSLSVGISGPGTVRAAIQALGNDMDMQTIASEIKRVAFKITRAGELVGRKCAARLGVPFNIVDLSLAPTPAKGDSVGDILEAIGLDNVGSPGTTAALAMLNDAVKRGGAMATSHAGGLSGAFIPVSEDTTMARSVENGNLTLEKLEAMTAVCSVGLDMLIAPGSTTAETISGILADEAAIGMINNKTTALRIIPVPGKDVGDKVDFGGLLGGGTVMHINQSSCETMISRGGRIPSPLRGLSN